MAESLLSTIEFQMSLLLFVALAGYLLAARINQSAVIGEILVGLLIGPSLLGLITYTDFVRSVAHLGAVILLFVIGLEFKLKDIFNFKYSIIALVGVIIPWIGGFYTAKLFGYGFGSAVFVGTALTATSIAITANVLREMGKLQTDAAKAIIGAAVIDDVLSLLALSMSEQIVSGTLSATSIGFVLFNASAFLIVGAYVGNKFLSRVVAKVDNTKIAKKFPEFVFIFAMMIAFFYAMIAELIHLSAIVGSFIAGVSLGSVVLRHSKDYKEGAEYLHIIFASIFFVSLGILADFHALTANVIWFLIALTIVAVLTKVIGCYIPAKLLGMSHQDSTVVGFGMSPRGEVAMIVALIGLNAGLIKQDIYVSLVLMSLLTTILTPIVLRNWLYKKSFMDAFKKKRVTLQ
ncbi:cation:proton antiporter [Candidatus Woesearchaeota archaeon]|nr:cation:proton antiporter [Candidatus Woesearchaeota archaeon]